jgi:hypothetical protein
VRSEIAAVLYMNMYLQCGAYYYFRCHTGWIAMIRKFWMVLNSSNSAICAEDGAGFLTYLAPSNVNLDSTMDKWPKVGFRDTREAA